jgi:hypothetical protein
MSRITVANVAWSTGRTSAGRPRALLRATAAVHPAAAVAN